MSKRIKDEDLRLNIIVNGDPARKEMGELDRQTKELARSNKELRTELRRLKSEGKENTALYKQNAAEIKKNNAAIKANQDRTKQLRSEMKLTSLTTAELSQRHAELRNAMRNVVPGTPQWRQLRNELQAVTTRMAQLRTDTVATEGVMCRMASNINKYMGTVAATFAAAAMYGSGLHKAIQSYSGLDEAMSNARKTTNMTRLEVEELNQKLARIDTRTPQNELLSLARIGGKLGIAKNDIEGFTRAADIIKISLGKDLGDNVETTIGQIGKLVNVFKIKDEFGIEEGMMKTAAAVNELGKASTANEANIVEFMRRIGGVGNSAKISLANIAGLGATLDDLGQTMEVAGTSMSQVITGMYRRTDAFAAAAKMSVKDFKKLMAEDMNEALIRMLDGMGSNGAAMGKIVAALDSLKLDGTRATGVLTALAQNTGRLREQQEIANRAYTEGTSCLKEFNIMNNSAEAIAEKRKKQITAEAAALGKSLLPAYYESLSAQASLIKASRILIEWLIKNKGAILVLIAAYVSYAAAAKIKEKWDNLLLARKKLLVTWSKAHQIALMREALAMKEGTASTKLMAAAQLLLAGNLRAAGLAFKAFFVSMGPVGWATLAISGLVSAIMLFSNRTSTAAKFQKLLSGHMRDAATEAATERTELDRLKGKLEGCKVGTKEYNDTKQEIIDKFGKYDSTLKSETLTVQTLRNKYDSLTAAIMQSAKTRQYNKFVEAQQTAFDEQFSEISDKLWEKLNDQYYTEKASKYYSQIMNAFFGGQPLDAWLTTGSAKAQRLVRQLQKLRDAQNAADKEARNRFGITSPSPTTTESTTTNNEPQNPNNPDPNPDFGDGNTDKKWSLDNDAAFLDEKQELRKKFADGEIATEQEYQDKLLALEIAALEARLTANKESGADRSKLEIQLADKLIEQKKREQQQADAAENLRIQNMTDATERENADYERQKKQYAGNTAALEQLAVQHERKLKTIQLDKVNTAIKAEEDAYKRQRQNLRNQQSAEMLSFTGTAEERTRLKKRHNEELLELDEQYARDMTAKLTELLENGNFEGFSLDTALLTEEEKTKLLQMITELQEKLVSLGVEKEKIKKDDWSPVKASDFLGFSQEDWETLFDNLKQGKVGVQEVAMAMKAMIEIYAMYDQFATAAENRSLKQFKKNNDAKKKDLERRLQQGSISQEQYNIRVEQMDAEYAAKEEELQIKQAQRKKAMSIVEAIVNTAVGATAAYKMGGIIGPILAAMISALGAAQVALIASQPIGGAEEGGMFVTRAQDGRKFNARANPDARGYIDRPTVLVGENGMEYVIPNEAMQNPTARPIINMIEAVRQKGRLRDFDFAQIMPAMFRFQGYAAGGPIAGSMPTDNTSLPVSGLYDSADIKKILEYLEYLCNKADEPIPAIVTLMGTGGFFEAIKKYMKLKKLGEL